MKKRTYSVEQVNTYIKKMFSYDFMLAHLCVRGEVSNCKYHSTGTIYFTLKDESGVLPAVMFAKDRGGISFQMREGDTVIVTGCVNVYERDGKYQFYAKEITLDGIGDLYARFEALKTQLEEMGMFAPEYKRKIPPYIRRLGIVTAKTGAAVQDIRNIATRRNPYVQLILYPALVQGEGAVNSIIQGIRTLDALGVDVIIVGRGGGSIEDLWAFNEEAVARAIFECETPVISAVGHETDTTIADYVADLRAPTPSAAAELAVFDYDAVFGRMMEQMERMKRLLAQKVEHTKLKLDGYQTKLHYLSPSHMLLQNRAYVSELQEEMQRRMKQILQEKQHELALLAEKMEGVSPVKKLSQGYAYVTDEAERAITDITKIRRGDCVTVHLLNGTFQADVTEIGMKKAGNGKNE